MRASEAFWISAPLAIRRHFGRFHGFVLFILSTGCSSSNAAPDAGAGSPPDASFTGETGSTSQSVTAPPTGTIHGVAHFTGVPPKAVKPPKLQEVVDCPQDLLLFPARVRDGKLGEVVVRLAGDVPFSKERADAIRPVLRVHGCNYEPRVQGAFFRSVDDAAFGIEVHGTERAQGRRVFHQPGGYRLREHAWWVVRDVESKWLDVLGVWQFDCAAHPWERAYALVTPHPYFAVTGEDGQFTIPDIPTGTYEVEGWHPHYGWKRRPNIEVRAGQTTSAELSYADSDPLPEESRP